MKKEKKIEKKETKLIFKHNDKQVTIDLSNDMTEYTFKCKDNFEFQTDCIRIFAKYSVNQNIFSSNFYEYDLHKKHLINIDELSFKHKTAQKVLFIYIYLANKTFSKKTNKYKLLHNYKLHIDSMQFIDSK